MLIGFEPFPLGSRNIPLGVIVSGSGGLEPKLTNLPRPQGGFKK